VTGRFHESQLDLTDIDLISITYSAMRKRCAGILAEYDLRSGAFGELAMSTHKIRVKVSFENILDGEPVRFRLSNVLVNVALRVNHHGLAF
jgi:hypothetical protein